MISVLYVDDEPGLLEIVRISLEASGGFTVTTTPSAGQAIGLLETGSFDAIVSDYMMPDIDGIAFLKTVRERDADIPFILFTGRGREEIVIDAINNGADFYLQKGGDPGSQFAELAHKIRQAVRRRETERELKRSEERLRSFFDTTRESVTLVDEEGTVIEWNPGAERISGIRKEEALGTRLWDLTFRMLPREHRTEERRALIEQRIRSSLETGIQVFEEPQVIESEAPDGSRVFTRQTLFPIRTKKGFRIGSIAQDITREKQAECALRESEERFRGMAERSSDLIIILNNAMSPIYVSPSVRPILGYDPEELVGKPPEFARATIFSRAGPALSDAVKATLAGQMVENVELQLSRKDNNTVYVSLFAVPVMRNNVLEGVQVSLRDITGRMATQSALHAVIGSMVGTTGLNSLQKITEAVSSWLDVDCVMIGEIQPDHETVKVLAMVLDKKAVNNFTYSLRGTPCENVAQKGFCHYPEDSVRLFPEAKDIVDLNVQGYAGTPLWNSRGDILGILCVLSRKPMQFSPAVREILEIIAVKAGAEIERAQIERVLQDNRQMLAKAMDLANLVHWEFDLGTGLFTFNDRFYSLYGTSAAREDGYQMLPERYLREFVHPEDRENVAAVLRGAPESPDPAYEFQMEHRIIRRDGEIRTIVVRVGVSNGTEGKSARIHGANQDITDTKRMENALRQANRKLNLLSGITRHDINNQLVALNGFISLLRDDIRDTSYDPWFSRITEASRNIAEMIEFTREYEQIGTGAPVWQDLTAVMNAGTKGILPPHIAIRNTLPASTEVFADPLLEKVFFNLLDNSVRHGQHVTEIRISACPSGEDLLVVWEDNGAGIAADEKMFIFERGFGKHTGLGMFLIREILSLTTITIRETGEPGKGARFEMTVPQGSFRGPF